MAVPKHLNTKYSAIIFEDTDALIKARVSASGTMSFSGLSTEMRTTTLDITDTAAKIPLIPLAKRNHIEVYNKSPDEILYIGTSSAVTADSVNGTTSGKEIPPASYWNIDITDAIEVWGIAESGKTIKVKVVEVA